MNRHESQYIMTAQAADKLIEMHDSDAALVYLYFCRHPNADLDRASKDLLLPRQKLNYACERLEMVGLLPLPSVSSADDISSVRNEKTSFVQEKPEPPEYTSGDVSFRAGSDPAFSALLSEAQLIIGRALSTPDLTKMLGIYDHLDLPAEVIMELMNFVADVYRDKYGERRRPSARAFELEAHKWIEYGITDFDAAEQYIRRYREQHSLDGAVKEALKITDRDFSDTERRYVDQWLTWGFLPDVIAFAYDKTVTNTGKRSMAYMNKILQTWHEKSLLTKRDIQEAEKPRHRISSESAGSLPKKADEIWDTVEQI